MLRQPASHPAIEPERKPPSRNPLSCGTVRCGSLEGEQLSFFFFLHRIPFGSPSEPLLFILENPLFIYLCLLTSSSSLVLLFCAFADLPFPIYPSSPPQQLLQIPRPTTLQFPVLLSPLLCTEYRCLSSSLLFETVPNSCSALGFSPPNGKKKIFYIHIMSWNYYF